MQEAFVIPAIVIGVIVVLGLAFWARFKTVSPDEAMVVTGSFLGSKKIRWWMRPDAQLKLYAGEAHSFCRSSRRPNFSRSCPISWTYQRLKFIRSKGFR